ncbi:MAG: EAL domain-containing protein, partial [Cyanobacteria bacterium P01_A01_bin.70]
DEQQWCLRIDQALEAHRFQLYHQPIARVDEIDGVRTHTELLVRMLGEKGKIIPPMAFIPAAERYHRMAKIDEWVILHFLAELSTRASHLDMLYNINLSGASLSDEEFLTFLRAQLTQKSVDATKICFEITETAAISNLHRVTTFMKSLKQLGCQFALDDFGSGMSSFRYLKQLPVDYIKIDGDFVQKLNEPVNQAIVQSICSIGQAMDVQIVAERVENLATAAQLRALGVDYVQGYGIARPSPFGSL